MQLSQSLTAGVVLAGKYRVERVLGHGGMGIVALVVHLQLDQRMALKLMLPEAMASDEAVSRFFREARAAARITSDHVVRVFDVGALETGEPYIAMEYLEGLDLSQLIAERGRLLPEEASDYLLQACEALAEAHSHGIIHRDLKPGNLFLAHRRDGQRMVKVLDFGISKVSSSLLSSDPATRTAALMGSPLYMSPEQMTSSRDVDARSDIWALGVVFYEMLSGATPFNGETLPQVCSKVMSGVHDPLPSVAPGLPNAVYQVVARCLRKEPTERFPDVAELAAALLPVASARGRESYHRIRNVLGQAPRGGLALTADGAPSSVAPAASETDASFGASSLRLTRNSPSARIALGLGGVVLLGGVGAYFALGQSVATSPEPATASAGAPPAMAPVDAPAPPKPALTSAPLSISAPKIVPEVAGEVKAKPEEEEEEEVLPTPAHAATTRAAATRVRAPKQTAKKAPTTITPVPDAPPPATPKPTKRSRL